MKDEKRKARLLSLLIVTGFGVMAFAASAQAVAPGFLINKKPAGSLLAVWDAVLNGIGTMLVPGLNFQLRCTTLEVDEGHIGSNTDAKGAPLFTGCTTLSITKFPEEIHCHVSQPIRVDALFLPAETTNNEPAVLAEKINALILLHLQGTPVLREWPCFLPLGFKVTGEACFSIDNNDSSLPTVLASGSIECKAKTALEGGTEGFGTTKDILKYGAQTVTLDGSANAFLLAPHAHFPLGVSLY